MDVPDHGGRYSARPGGVRCWASGSPVFGLTSTRGKLLLEISSRILCPRRKTREVGYSSIVNSKGCPATKGLARSSDSRANDTVADVEIDSRGIVGAGWI